MKGLFFTELIELLEADYGLAVVDRVIRAAVPPTDGAYTSMGNYDAEEFFGLINAFSAEMDQPVSTIQRSFGRHFMRCLMVRNHKLVGTYSSAIKAIKDVNKLIRAARILPPDATLPDVTFSEEGESIWQLTIHLPLQVRDMVLGALEACIARYEEPLIVSRTDIEVNGQIATRFEITLSPKATSCLTTFK
jgi:hypothetical protein